MMDLSKEQLDRVIAIIRANIPDRRVYLFGSRAQGAAKPFSDIDLAIVGDEAVPFATLSVLRDAFSESDLPFRVDLVDWTTASEEFRRKIEKEWQEIYRP